MNELITVEINENNEPIVSARALYDFLGFDKSQWSRWYKKNILEDDMFRENIDYVTLDITSNGNQTKDFCLKIHMAKELSMLARTENGKMARKYFIECEEKWNSPEMILIKADQIKSRMIEKYIQAMQNSQNAKLRYDNFFIESNYKSGTGKEYKCFLLTKKGCDMVANKMTMNCGFNMEQYFNN